MLNQHEIMQTIQMIDQQHLDVRTITMGISLLSCAHSDVDTACAKVYDKITKYAEKLVATGQAIEKEFGIPIVNKRISVTPIALVAAAAETDSYVPYAQALDRAAKTCGVIPPQAVQPLPPQFPLVGMARGHGGDHVVKPSHADHLPSKYAT